MWRWNDSIGSRNGSIASKGSTPSAWSRSRSSVTCPSCAAAIDPSSTLSASVGASLASSASRSNAEISP